MNTKLLFTLLILHSIQLWSQSIATNQTDKEYCPHSRRLSYIHPKDSIRRQAVLDSINRLLVGRWQLIDIGTKTYYVMPTAEDSIQISIDEQGSSIVRSKGKQVVDFQVAAGINYGNLRCVISEAGRAYFRFRTPRVRAGQRDMNNGETIYPNGLRVCEEYLEIYAFTSAGPYYVFKRLTSVQVENKQRN